MLDLESAIKHASEMAEDRDMKAGFETDNQAYAMSEAEREVYKMGAEEHRQLAEWLKELKAVKDIIAQHDADRMPEDYWYIDKIREVLNEK